MTLYHFFNLLKSNKKALFIAVTLMVFESAVSLAVPWFAGKFSESMLEGKLIFNLSYMQIALIWLLLFMLQALLRFLSTYRVNFIGAKMLTELSCRLYDHIQLLPVSYFNTTKKGDTLALLSNDVSIISYFLTGVLTGLVPVVLILCGALVLMASINITITLVILLTVPAFFVVLKLLGKGIRPLTQNLVQRQADSVAIASENFGSIELIKAFTRENVESNRFKMNAHDIQALRKKQLKIQAILSPVLQLLVSVVVLAVVVICARYYQAGELTMSEIIMLLMYGMLFARPMSALANLYGQVQQALGSSHRLNQVFSHSPEPNDIFSDNGQQPDEAITGPIIFKQVSFGYQPDVPLLNNISMHIPYGETVMILGENGTGKTTVLHLLMRFIAPSSGDISIGGKELSQFSLSNLRSQIGFVSQDIALCSGTILDNIAFGYPEASLTQIQAVAKKAGAHDFINTLAQGYHTQVGENGVLLSGGQRQKISLSRALLSNPSILLLDEPTSMIDKESKAEFQHNLKQLFAKQTVLIVTHDSALSALADKVFTMQNDGSLQQSIQNR
jgi:ATP-binding cassette subfamily B protein